MGAADLIARRIIALEDQLLYAGGLVVGYSERLGGKDLAGIERKVDLGFTGLKRVAGNITVANGVVDTLAKAIDSELISAIPVDVVNDIGVNVAIAAGVGKVAWGTEGQRRRTDRQHLLVMRRQGRIYHRLGFDMAAADFQVPVATSGRAAGQVGGGRHIGTCGTGQLINEHFARRTSTHVTTVQHDVTIG